MNRRAQENRVLLLICLISWALVLAAWLAFS